MATHCGAEQLVFSIDLGTTNSSVSYVHLQPGNVPHVRSVTRWPGQEDAAGDSKIPTLVRYRQGEPIAFGADAVENPDGEGDEESHLAQWFKLHLHPASMRAAGNIAAPPLPPGVTLARVYADFLGFLFAHAVGFFVASAHDGARIWARLESGCVLVLATPNGWDAVQQGFLRDAVRRAALSIDGARLQFVTEAEASVHFALERTHGAQWLHASGNFAVLDAGGSTVDTTVYRCTATAPKLQLEEATSSECVQAGSVFVNRDAEQLLRSRLANSKFGTDECIAQIMDVFEKKTKRRFDGSEDPSVISFGRMQDNDAEVGVSRGRITLSSDEVKLAFQNSLTDILTSCERIIARSKCVCDVILLVGGYSESPYLRTTLRDMLALSGVQFITVDDGTKKAAAEGATIWYMRQLVQARAMRAHFGVSYTLQSVENPERYGQLLNEQPRSERRMESGATGLNGTFKLLVSKHESVRTDATMVSCYERYFAIKPDIRDMEAFSSTIYAVDGDQLVDWVVTEDGEWSPGVRRVCVIQGDMSGLHGMLQAEKNPRGETFWRIRFDIVVSFGMTALHACLQWKENGVMKSGPLQVIPESFVHV